MDQTGGKAMSVKEPRGRSAASVAVWALGIWVGYAVLVLFPERVVTEVRDGVEVEVEGRAACQASRADGVEPVAHELGGAGRIDTAAGVSEEGRDDGAEPARGCHSVIPCALSLLRRRIER